MSYDDDLRDVNSFLMGGAKSATFPTIGTKIQGKIVEPKPKKIDVLDPKTRKPEYWDNGNKKEQILVTLQTNERDPQDDQDDGLRRLFMKGNLQNAVAAAVRAAGAKGIALGGIISVEYVSDGVKPGPGLSPPKEYKAVYIPPKEPVVPVESSPQKDPGAQQTSASSPDELSPEGKAALEAMFADQ